MQLGAEVVPALMSGPGAGELPEDRPEDGDKPKVPDRAGRRDGGGCKDVWRSGTGGGGEGWVWGMGGWDWVVLHA